MPKGKKGGKKGKGKKAASAKSEAPPITDDQTDKEVILQKELDQLTEELTSLKDNVASLRKENDWLQQESNRVRNESHEYMSYMEKKMNKRQTTIISLSDQNQKEIHDIKEEKQSMLDEFEEKKKELKGILLDREKTLANIKQELNELSEYKSLQHDQQSKIRDLEREVMKKRSKHSEALQNMKMQFLKHKRNYQQESESKVTALAKQANKEAMECLADHTLHIKDENRRLRHELLLLIRKTKALQDHKQHLEEQKGKLEMEQKCARDLKLLRSARQQAAIEGVVNMTQPDDASVRDNFQTFVKA